MSDLFISYSRLDREFVAKLASRLRALKRDVWVDLDDILPTEKWLDKVYRGIDEANHFAFVLSPNSVASAMCAQELARAVDGHKRLLPLAFKPLERSPAPAPLAELNWILFLDEAGFEVSLAQLLRALDSDPDWINLHTHFQVRAREWEQGKQHGSFALRGLELQKAIQWLGEAAKNKEPKPTELQSLFIQFSQQTEAKEVARYKHLYASALARQLAAQAELAREQQAPLIERSVLLAVESLMALPTPEGAETLRRSLALLPPCRACLTVNGPVTDVHIAPSSAVLAAAFDNSVQLWRVPLGDPIGTIPHPVPVNALSFDPTGRFLAVATGGYSPQNAGAGLVVYDLERWAVTAVLPHPDRVVSVVWNRTGPLLATGCADDHVRVWDLRGVRELQRLKHNGQADTLAFSPDGKWLACAGIFDSAVLLYPAAAGTLTGPPRRLAHDFADKVTAVAFSPDSKLLAAVDGFNVGQTSTFPIRIWDLELGQLRQTFYLNHAEYAVRSVSFSPDGLRLLVTGGDQTARVLSLGDGGEIARLPHDGIVNTAAWSADAKWLVTGGDDSRVRIWPEWDGQEVAAVRVRECVDPRNAFAFDVHPAGKWGALAVWDLKILDLQTGAVMATTEFGSLALGVRYSPDGRLIALCGKTEEVRVLDAVTLRLVRQFPHSGFVSEAVFDNKSARVATAAWDGVVRVFDVAQGTQLASFAIGGIVTAVKFSPDAAYLAACSQSNLLVVWKLSSGAEVLRRELSGIPWSIDFDPGSSTIACGGQGVQLWRLENASDVISWPDQVSSVRFSGDGKHLASASGGVRLWDLESYREVAFLPNTGSARALHFTKDGRYLITAGKENTDCLIRTWFVEVPDLIAEGKRRVTRSLSESERRTFLPDEPADPLS